MEHAGFQRSIVAYLPLVRSVVRQVTRRLPANVQHDDLIAAGVCGLVDSLRRTDGGQGDGFEWYARTRIRGAVIDELRAQDWLSRRARASVGVTPAAQFVSLDELGGASDLTGVDLWETIVMRSDCRALERALATLPDRERTVIGRYFFEEVRMKDIGVELGVSEPRISQLLTRALQRLRCLLERH